MANITECIQYEYIDKLSILLSNVQCNNRYPDFLFQAISFVKPRATEVIFKYCGKQLENSMDQYNNSAVKAVIYSYKDAKPQQKQNALSVLEVVAKHSNDINIKDEYGDTPLMTAAYLGLDEAISVLLRYGADYSIIDASGNNALDKALWEGHKIAVVAFFQHNSSLKDAPVLSKGQTPLTKTLYGKKTEMVEFLLKQNVSKEAQNQDGMTPNDIAKEMGVDLQSIDSHL